jgi:dienelactone hydrolase
VIKYLLLLMPLAWSTPVLTGTYPVSTPPTPFSGSRFYVPSGGAKHSSIVMLHGSEGGSEPFVDLEAGILATQGYAVLVLCYFDCNRDLSGPKQSLANVETNLVLNAVAWMRVQPLSNAKVAVYGFSRGAELAMITGGLAMTAANRPDAIIAHSPSDVFNGEWNWSWQDPACWLCTAGIGHCTQTSPDSAYTWNPGCGGGDPNQIDLSQSAWLVSGTKIPAGRRIEIEKYDGPILITVGLADEVWPVDQTRRLEATLKAAGKTPEVHYFPNEGHVFKGPNQAIRRQMVLDFLKSKLLFYAGWDA